MKNLILLFLTTLLSSGIFAQDTTIVQIFTFDSTGRSGVFQFPDEPSTTYEKIILQYTMRCHDALIGNGNVGCWEWDYSNHTVVVDSSQTDSLFATHPSHIITNTDADPYYYVTSPTFTYFKFIEREVIYNNTITEENFVIGNGSEQLDQPFKTSERTGKTQLLWTASELTAQGLTAGEISGMKLDISDAGSDIDFLKIKMKNTSTANLDALEPDMDGFTEVYFLDTPVNGAGEKQFNFYQVFNWDGTSNLLLEISFTNPSSGTDNLVNGETTAFNSCIFTQEEDAFLSLNYGDYIEVPPVAFQSVDSAITISFWQYGDININPHNSYIFEGGDDAQRRIINCHLPWGNGNVYWDAGNSGTSSYDRINAQADFDDYAGKWNHWALTKNVATGEMKIYLNGNLWLSGNGKTRTMEGITRFTLGGNDDPSGKYDAYLNEFRIWDTELDSNLIREYMHKDVDPAHPNYSNLLLYYKFENGNGNTIIDHSAGGHDGVLHGEAVWSKLKGHELINDFSSSQQRPNVIFLRGQYDQTINEYSTLDSLQNGYNMVYDFYVENFNLIPNDTNMYWEAGNMPVLDEENNLVDNIYIAPQDSIHITTLEYYQKSPSKFKLVSFVTPYGNGLDLGEDGKMWEFDLTDFAPVLKGERFIQMQGGGQWSEEFDLKFLFIEGTPARDVLSIQNIWPVSFSAAWITPILEDQRFEPRQVLMNPEAEAFKIRTIVTGHHQDGEFIAKRNFLNVEDTEFEFIVWNECSTIPIYPQGGTWIYDRAGWCPGDPSTLWEFDITELVSPGDSAEIDYGMKYYPSVSDAVYIVSNQLVTYGPPNFNLDASVVSIGKPNATAAFQRFNPACMNPQVSIKNTGAETIGSLDIEYFVDDGEVLNYSWTGSLDFLDTLELELPVTDMSFWNGSSNHFNVSVSNPNGEEDEYLQNNSLRIEYREVDIYDDEQIMFLECKTNNYGMHTSYYVFDAAGNIILERTDLDDNTIYSDELDLAPGCYRIRIEDAADDGLYWWHNSTQGTGHFRIENSIGIPIKTFEPEFGGFMEYEFAIADITGIEDNQSSRMCGIFPNPTIGPFNIQLTGYKDQKVLVEVFSEKSILLKSREVYVNNEKLSIQMEIGNLPAGIYLVRIKTADEIRIRKIVKK